jgi:hypothetical protein
VWADEADYSTPRTELESFYVLAALEFGDPDNGKHWLEDNAVRFYAYLRKYLKAAKLEPDSPHMHDGPAVLIQYIIWYQNNRPQS